MSVDFTDCPEIKDKLTEVERKVYDDVLNMFKSNVVSAKALNIIFAIILLYACFALLPVWAAVFTYRTKACNTCSKTYPYSVRYH